MKKIDLKQTPDEETNYIKCCCHSEEHFLLAKFDQEDNYVYVSMFLKEHSFFKRAWNGIKYIFGHKSVFGHFEETVLSYNECQHMIRVLSQVVPD